MTREVISVMLDKRQALMADHLVVTLYVVVKGHSTKKLELGTPFTTATLAEGLKKLADELERLT